MDSRREGLLWNSSATERMSFVFWAAQKMKWAGKMKRLLECGFNIADIDEDDVDDDDDDDDAEEDFFL